MDNVIMPRMSNWFSRGDDEKAKGVMDYVMLFAMCASTPLAFGLAVVSDTFAPWFYGDAFARCGYYMLLLSPTILFKAWAGALRTQYIIPTGKDNVFVVSLTGGAIINIILDLLLIPPLHGVGAIIGTIAAEFTVAFIQFFLCRKDIRLREYMLDALVFCSAGMLMFLGVAWIPGLGLSPLVTLILQVAGGAVIYLPLAAFGMTKIRKKPVLVQEAMKTVRRIRRGA